VDDLSPRSRERTDRVLVAHAATYGGFRGRELVWKLAPAEYELRERSVADAAGGAGVRLTREDALEVHTVSRVAGDRPQIVSPIVGFAGSDGGGESASRDDDRVAEVRWSAEQPNSLLYDALSEFPMPGDG
jgi:hypothetical protein